MTQMEIPFVRYCRAVPPLQHGNRTCTGERNNIYGSTCTSSCDSGYRLNGTKQVSCQSNTNWNAAFPTFQLRYCRAVPPLQHGNRTCTGKRNNIYGSTCTSSCDSGYRLNGTKQVSCQYNTNWNAAFPSCQLRYCRAVPPLQHGNRTCTGKRNNIYGSTCTSSCDSGYRLNGTKQVSCQYNTNWNAAFPSCQLRYCRAVPPLQHGNRTCTGKRNNIYGSTCTSSCDSGYRLNGTKQVSCQSNTNWNAAFPSCQLPAFCQERRGKDVSSHTRAPPVGVFDAIQCGLRPRERVLRRRRQAVASSDSGLAAPRELAPPRVQKIVGGDLAQHGMYPWQVRIGRIFNVYSNGKKLVKHWCGGTILSNHWVLSAAHCFKDKDYRLSKSDVSVWVGDHGWNQTDTGEQKILVEKLIIHGSYRKYRNDYDIALLKVKSTDGESISFNNYVHPACLPASLDVYVPGTECLISGWGNTQSRTEGRSLLRAARVPIMGFDECQSLYHGMLTERMLCAGYLKGGIDTCQGDSGGPLVCMIDGSYTVLGITSWGYNCSQPNAPGVYAKAGQFLRWIEDTIRNHSCPP